MLPFVEQSARDNRGEKAGACFNQAAARCLHLLAGDGNFGILSLSKRDRFFAAISGGGCLHARGKSKDNKTHDGPKLQTHPVYLLGRAFFFNKNCSLLSACASILNGLIVRAADIYPEEGRSAACFKIDIITCILPEPPCCG